MKKSTIVVLERGTENVLNSTMGACCLASFDVFM